MLPVHAKARPTPHTRNDETIGRNTHVCISVSGVLLVGSMAAASGGKRVKGKRKSIVPSTNPFVNTSWSRAIHVLLSKAQFAKAQHYFLTAQLSVLHDADKQPDRTSDVEKSTGGGSDSHTPASDRKQAQRKQKHKKLRTEVSKNETKPVFKKNELYLPVPDDAGRLLCYTCLVCEVCYVLAVLC